MVILLLFLVSIQKSVLITFNVVKLLETVPILLTSAPVHSLGYRIYDYSITTVRATNAVMCSLDQLLSLVNKKQ